MSSSASNSSRPEFLFSAPANSPNHPNHLAGNAIGKKSPNQNAKLITSLSQEALLEDFIFLLQQTGESLLTPSAYDTAWVARLTTSPNESTQLLFPEALHWLLANQHPDGSWGEGGSLERVLATLAALITLQEHLLRLIEPAPAKIVPDFGLVNKLETLLKAGTTYLKNSLAEFPALFPGHSESKAKATSKEEIAPVLPVGFELLVSSLIQEASELNLPIPPQFSNAFENYRQEKMALLSRLKPAHLAASSAVFSLEFYGRNLPGQAELFVHPVHGSLGGSPSATASVLRFVTDPPVRECMINFLLVNRQMLKAIHLPVPTVAGSGKSQPGQVADYQAQAAWPTVTGINVFEWLWVLYNLRLCMPELLTKPGQRLAEHTENSFIGQQKNIISKLVGEHLNQIITNWSDQTGLPVSTAFIEDSDDTAMGFILLKEAEATTTFAKNITLNALEPYWRRDKAGNEQYLVTYPLERDPSTSANIHGLEAYALAGNSQKVQILLNFLRTCRTKLATPPNSANSANSSTYHYQPHWQDKWHISPYYPTSHALMVYCRYSFDLDIVEESINWILNSQRFDGGWGWEEESTLEETAYVVQALLAYKNSNTKANLGEHQAGETNQRARKATAYRQKDLEKSLKAGVNFLRTHYQPFSWETHPLWVGKNRYSPLLVVHSAVLSALLLADKYKL